MKRDEIKFNQTRWTKKSHDQPPKTKQGRRKENPSYDFQFEEDLSISEDHHDIYSPHDSGGEMPRPVISPPSKILNHDTEEHVLAENRKRMSSFRKDSMSISEDPGKDYFDESLNRPQVESGRGWKKNNPFLPEILALLKEDPSPDWSSMNDPQEMEDEDFKDYSILTDIVSSMGESSDDRHGFRDHYQAQKNISVDDENSIFPEKEKSDEVEVEESTSDNLFHEVCSMLDESSSWSEKVEWSYDEEESSETVTNSFDEDPNCTMEDEEDSFCELEQEEVESSSSLESSCEEEEESSSTAWNMTVKVPVLLSTKKVEVNLMETLNIPDDLCEIIDIQLSIHSQKETVVLPSSYVFLSGVLMVEVIYDNGESLQQLKQTVPWEKTVCVEWKKEPQIRCSDRKEYTFDCDETGNVHYEFVETFVEPVEVETQSVRFVSHSDASVADGKLCIQGSAQIVYDLLQKQYVRI
ncbi:hypothetical protein [Halobacillus trueperi]|uniref:DUF3794 domain-containing protein n=1 Tax=Halobacillus trueperi TaxID=156205 RepID=A0A3E0J8N1_9BACI|nr:hypothetical protein [Halobacillus trueperi]REJ09273.1 hypothetical protein DYE48_11180 [Halobacillus trueperi]